MDAMEFHERGACLAECGSIADRTLWHGTSESFARFDPAAPIRNHPLSALGVFLSADFRVAATFAMRDEVVDAAYDGWTGSRGLVRDPWRIAGGDPFRTDAAVLECRADIRNPAVMHLAEWIGMVEDAVCCPDVVDALRARLEAAGHDGMLVPRWDGTPLGLEWCEEPCVEHDADLVCAFDASRVAILDRHRPEAGWTAARPTRAGHPRMGAQNAFSHSGGPRAP